MLSWSGGAWLRLWLAASAPAPGGTFDDQLQWTAPPGCPTHAQVLKSVERLTAEVRPEVTAAATVSRRGDGWVVELVITSTTGRSRHVLTADDCHTLVDAVVLIIAVHLDPGAGTPSASTEPAAEQPEAANSGAESEAANSGAASEARPGAASEAKPGAASEARPETRSEARESAALSGGSSSRDSDAAAPTDAGRSAAARRLRRLDRPKPRRRREPPAETAAKPASLGAASRRRGGTRSRRPALALGGFAAFGVGTVPQTDVGPGIVAALAFSRWRLELAGQHWFPQRTQIPDHDPAGAVIDAWSAGLRGCPLVVDSAAGGWELPLCLGVEAGVVRARPVALDRVAVRVGPWLAAGASPRLHWRFKRWASLWIGADALAVVLAPRFRADGLPQGDGVFYRSRPFVARAVVGLEFRLTTQPRR
ncbi:MAG: hypothetical protein B7733_13175 [Myxococcales bacterium FL481]|nr:MAG: hypothetical protein B7733_13175 [Myxococcales bacterium FL481]